MPDHVIESAEGHSFFEQVTALQDRVAELEDAIRQTLALRSSFDADQGREVKLVNNWQARELLERALKGKGLNDG